MEDKVRVDQEQCTSVDPCDEAEICAGCGTPSCSHHPDVLLVACGNGETYCPRCHEFLCTSWECWEDPDAAYEEAMLNS